MLHELQENPKDFSNFSYETACSGNSNVLNFSEFHTQDGPFSVSDESKVVPITAVYFRDFKSEGDSRTISEEIEEFNPYIQQEHLPNFDEFFSSGVMSDPCAAGDSLWSAPIPGMGNFIPPPSYQPNELSAPTPGMGSFIPPPVYQPYELKIKYTKQYLMSCRRFPRSHSFPDCLLKYVVMNELPLKQKKQEDLGDYRNMDHILFYNSLPFSRKKYPYLENAYMRKKLSVYMNIVS